MHFRSHLRLRVLTFANAGHLAPYHNGKELVAPPALPLGLVPEPAFVEQTVQLAPGDRLTLVTDGVPEATYRGELFGFERTGAISLSPAAAIADAAISYGQEDDITAISIVWKGMTILREPSVSPGTSDGEL